ncbi:MAG: NfeD family protein [Prevotella sp.]|nr:NfeD family protein [Prevotella sp.]MBR2292178.1 NfeD family protein [Prevotella sp.]
MIEYFSENMWQLWAVVAVLGLILELGSGDFFIICFSIGAVGAAAVSPLANVYVQVAVFVVLTAVSIFTVRPFALRYLHRGEDARRSNADALMGRTGRVTEEIPAGGFGRVAIDGDSWKARTDAPDALPTGTQVVVVGRESTIITVNKL